MDKDGVGEAWAENAVALGDDLGISRTATAAGEKLQRDLSVWRGSGGPLHSKIPRYFITLGRIVKRHLFESLITCWRWT